jgi:hypothetical protein
MLSFYLRVYVGKTFIGREELLVRSEVVDGDIAAAAMEGLSTVVEVEAAVVLVFVVDDHFLLFCVVVVDILVDLLDHCL